MADLLSLRFPFQQAADGDSHCSGKGLLAKPHTLSVGTDAVRLSIVKEAVELVHEVCDRYAVEACQLLHHGSWDVLGDAALNINVGCP